MTSNAPAKTGDAAPVVCQGVAEIMVNHAGTPVPTTVEQEFQQILAEARRELVQ